MKFITQLMIISEISTLTSKIERVLLDGLTTS